jgi:A/G-specific adenine glycosylase
MLQKTHAVQQVLPVYKNFMDKFPNPSALSKASIDEIRQVIRSLGLHNTRSKRLKELSGVLINQFKGEVPRESVDLLNLPGVGGYVANAVECIAFDQAKEMVDANVGRVLGRVFFGKEEYPPSHNRTGKIAKELSQVSECKELNLGIIDLGAMVCTPKKPKCNICPLKQACLFYNNSLRVS